MPSDDDIADRLIVDRGLGRFSDKCTRIVRREVTKSEERYDDHRDPKKNHEVEYSTGICGHSRADHLVDPRALNVMAVDACNSCDCTHWAYEGGV